MLRTPTIQVWSTTKSWLLQKKVHPPLLFLINFQVQIDPNLSGECFMIETTKNIVWAVNSLFLVLWLQYCSISLPTLYTYIDFRLLNHNWQNTFGKGHIAKNSNVSQSNNTVLQEKVLQCREAPIQVVNVCCITIYCLLTRYIDENRKLLALVLCSAEWVLMGS